MSGCYCGEFDRPTIAPDEFGETCFHERGKCEVPPVPVPIETVLRLTRARAEQAEAAIRRVRGIPEKESDVGYPNDWHIGWNACRESVLDALEERGRGQR